MKASDKSVDFVPRDASNLESFHYPAKISFSYEAKIISFTRGN